MASRDPKDLREDVKTAWEHSSDEYAINHPGTPQPFLTCTYRSVKEQNDLYALGRTKPGKIVTNAKGGQSNHNSKPCRAFDIAFIDREGKLAWDQKLFARFAKIAKTHGLAWGGDWKSFKDYPHFEGSTQVA